MPGEHLLMPTLPLFKGFSPENIIVRMPNWLGDLVMATPILSDLRHHWPKSKITAMCQGSTGEILKEDPHIDEILNFKKPNGWLHRKKHGDVLLPLKQGNYDLGILTTNSFSSAWLFWKGNVANTIGFDTFPRRWLIDYPIPFPKERLSQHLVYTYKSLLVPLGIPISSTPPKLYLSKEEQIRAHEALKKLGFQSDNIVIGINPGAAYGSAKCWLPDRFKEVAKKLLQNPRVKILFFGDKSGAPVVHEICNNLPPDRAINLAGKTNLRELMALIESCQVLLTNDSGPMHMASALGVPLLALFGSTSDITTGPFNGGKVIHRHVACSPCYRRECPIDFRCMTQIGVQDVYDQLLDILNEEHKDKSHE